MSRPIYLLILFFVWDNMLSQMSIHSNLYLGSEYELYNEFDLTTFHSGIVTVDRNGGVFSFAPNGLWENSDDLKYIDGRVRKYNPRAFTFPIGHLGSYQPFHISLSDNNTFIDATFVAGSLADNTLSNDLNAVHSQFYWKVENATETGKISLSWNTNNNLSTLIGNNSLDKLTISGWNGSQWDMIPSLVDVNSFIDFSSSSILSGSISTNSAIDLSNYTAYTLGLKKEGALGVGTIKVAEGVTPNNDGRNDTWIIEGIEAYPEAQIYVYNRSGKVVFATLSGYDNSWANTFNNNDEPLPSGPYFFTIDLDADGVVDEQGWIYINY